MIYRQVRIWDPLIRVFHWTLVVAFTVAYLTEDDVLQLHAIAGYTIGGLILFRVLWGFVGSKHARFRDFVKPYSEVRQYLKDLLSGNSKRYIGHNPAGGLMILILLFSLLLTTASGLIVYGAEENAGPLAVLAGAPHWVEKASEEIHEFFANFTLLLVGIHVAGVIVSSLLYRENLIKAMWTGRKVLELPEPIDKNRPVGESPRTLLED